MTEIKREYPNLPIYDGTNIFRKEMSIDDLNHLTTWYTERAVKFIDANTNRPFFLYVAQSMPHVPLGVSEKFRRPRSTSVTLKRVSRARICWLTALCVMELSEAALEKLPVSARSQKTLKVSMYMPCGENKGC